MTQVCMNVNDAFSMERAKEIARKTLAGDHDPLLACRDLASIRVSLLGLAADAMDIFVGVASEIDGLPIGDERERWAAEVLKSKDIEAADYRERVRSVVKEALQELLAAVDKL